LNLEQKRAVRQKWASRNGREESRQSGEKLLDRNHLKRAGRVNLRTAERRSEGEGPLKEKRGGPQEKGAALGKIEPHTPPKNEPPVWGGARWGWDYLLKRRRTRNRARQKVDEKKEKNKGGESNIDKKTTRKREKKDISVEPRSESRRTKTQPNTGEGPSQKKNSQKKRKIWGRVWQPRCGMPTHR